MTVLEEVRCRIFDFPFDLAALRVKPFLSVRVLASFEPVTRCRSIRYRFSPMQNFNLTVFSALNAGSAPHLAAIRFGVFAADWLVYAVPALLLLTWVMGARPTRRQAIEAGVGACVALALAQVIGHFWYSPRPFVLGIGTQLIPHAPDGSFPSDHATFVCSVAAGLLIASTTRAAGLALAVIAAAVGWGRIYVGVHWPLDIAGGALVGTAGALAAHLYGRPVTALLDRIGESVHAVAFTRLHERSIRID